jgi:hypothetical protein
MIEGLLDVRSLELEGTGDALKAQIEAAESKLIKVSDRVSALQLALETEGDVLAVVKVLGKLEIDQRELTRKVAELRSEKAEIEATKGIDAIHEISELAKPAVWEQPEAHNEDRKKLQRLIGQSIERIEVSVTRDKMIRRCHAAVTMMDGRKWQTIIEVHVKCPWAILLTDVHGHKTPIQYRTEKPDVVTPWTIERIARKWGRGEKLPELAKEIGVSLSTLYRHRPN